MTGKDKTRILVIAPHPDDEVLGCGGSIANHVDAGREVAIAYLTSGEQGATATDRQAAGTIREREATQAAAALGVPETALRFLRLGDGLLDPHDTDQFTAVMALLREQRPQLLYLPHPDDASFDHQAAFALCWRAAGMAGSRNYPQCGAAHWVPTILGYEVWSPIGAPQYLEDITSAADRRLAALHCYASQSAAAKGEGQASHVGAPGMHLPGFRGASTTGGFREAFSVLRLGSVIA
ncbi:PIG-L deacetylase family protein [Catellatospora sp. NPDC049609]|uniref:PIG-L deacetylase family protein n=1 Tax=Catellatospora sp. NPDC049609 TaxID=3155505 RepID=UPI00344AD347